MNSDYVKLVDIFWIFCIVVLLEIVNKLKMFSYKICMHIYGPSPFKMSSCRSSESLVIVIEQKAKHRMFHITLKAFRKMKAAHFSKVYYKVEILVSYTTKFCCDSHLRRSHYCIWSSELSNIRRDFLYWSDVSTKTQLIQKLSVRTIHMDVIAPCSLFKVNRCFGGIYRLHLDARRIRRVSNQREKR
jgi:hypothetical protein